MIINNFMYNKCADLMMNKNKVPFIFLFSQSESANMIQNLKDFFQYIPIDNDFFKFAIGISIFIPILLLSSIKIKGEIISETYPEHYTFISPIEYLDVSFPSSLLDYLTIPLDYSSLPLDYLSLNDILTYILLAVYLFFEFLILVPILDSVVIETKCKQELWDIMDYWEQVWENLSDIIQYSLGYEQLLLDKGHEWYWIYQYPEFKPDKLKSDPMDYINHLFNRDKQNYINNIANNYIRDFNVYPFSDTHEFIQDQYYEVPPPGPHEIRFTYRDGDSDVFRAAEAFSRHHMGQIIGAYQGSPTFTLIIHDGIYETRHSINRLPRNDMELVQTIINLREQMDNRIAAHLAANRHIPGYRLRFLGIDGIVKMQEVLKRVIITMFCSR